MKYLATFFGIALFIVLVGAYIAPNDIAQCDASPTEKTGCGTAEAIVAVSGGNTALRAARAIELYKQGWAEYLVFSGAAFDEASPSNATVMARQAVEAGVPADVILTDDDARTTQENARNTRDLFTEENIESIILVTSPYHQRRANIEFKQLFPSSVAIRNSPVVNDEDWPWYWWATPRGWWLTSGEMAKILMTYMRGTA